MQFLDCKITLSFSNQKNKDRSETLINKGKYEVKLKFIVSLIIGNNVDIGAGAIVKNQDVPNDSIVFGESPNLIIKTKKK